MRSWRQTKLSLIIFEKTVIHCKKINQMKTYTELEAANGTGIIIKHLEKSG